MVRQKLRSTTGLSIMGLFLRGESVERFAQVRKCGKRRSCLCVSSAAPSLALFCQRDAIYFFPVRIEAAFTCGGAFRGQRVKSSSVLAQGFINMWTQGCKKFFAWICAMRLFLAKHDHLLFHLCSSLSPHSPVTEPGT